MILYEIYSANPKKGLVSRAPHCRDTGELALAEKVKRELLDKGAHVIIRKFGDDKMLSIDFTVNYRALKQMEEEND